ncbi:MAG TPA: L-threonylcarbamoyladenylate synthase [Burkholderiaceae bacterium]|nr:L-threonylcarbamoyladenylate synthase [Burkholderiaceae bacterium]
MAQFFEIHPVDPQPRLIRQAAAIVNRGGVIALPTDSSYALAAQLDDKSAAERLRRIRRVDERHHMTLCCSDLSEIASYARLDNQQYRLIKAVTPGAYTFILEATREVPRRLSHPQRRTIGLRVPAHPVAKALLAELGRPLLTTTLVPPGETDPLNDPEEIRARFEHEIDLVIDSGACIRQPTTVVDLTGGTPELVRAGAGPLEPLGLTASA